MPINPSKLCVRTSKTSGRSNITVYYFQNSHSRVACLGIVAFSVDIQEHQRRSGKRHTSGLSNFVRSMLLSQKNLDEVIKYNLVCLPHIEISCAWSLTSLSAESSSPLHSPPTNKPFLALSSHTYCWQVNVLRTLLGSMACLRSVKYEIIHQHW